MKKPKKKLNASINVQTPTREAILMGVLHQLSHELDAQAILQKAVQAIFQLNRWQSVGFSVPTLNGQAWVSTTEICAPAGRTNECYPIDRGVIGRVYRTGETQLVPNTALDPDFFVGAGLQQVGSELATPIKFDDQILGVMNLESQQADAFSPEDVDFAHSLSGIIAIALKNAERLTALNAEIAERKRVEESLRRSEALLAEAQKLGRIGHIEWNIGNNELVFSDEMYDILGLPYNTVITQHTLAFMISPEDRQRLREADRQVLEQRSELDYEYRVTLPDGRERWLRQHGRFNFDESGRPVRMMAVCQDITESRQAQIKLKHSEENMNRAQAVAHIGSWILDIQTGELEWSDETYRIFNLPIGQKMTSREFFSFVHPDDLRDVAQTWASAQHETFYQQDHRIILKNGNVRWVREIAQLFFSVEGKPITAIGTVQDITERKQAELALYHSNERFSELINNITDVFWVADPQTGKNIYVSPAFEAMIGLSPASVEHLPGGFLDVVLPEDRHILVEAREQETWGMKTDIQYRVRRPDGSIVWLRDTGTPVLDENGRVLRVVGMLRDMTEWVESGMRLLDSETRFRQIAETIDEVFWVSDPEISQTIYISPGYERIWGRTQDSLYAAPQSFIDAVVPEDREKVMAVFGLQQAGLQFAHEYRICHTDGSIHFIWDRAYPVRDETGQVIRYVGVAQDITERKQAENRLRDSEEKYRKLSEELELRVQERTAEVRDLYENAPTGYHSLDPDGRFFMVNQTELNWLGYQRAEVIGQLFQELITEKSRHVFLETFPRFKKEGFVKDLELEFICKSGSILPVLLNSVAIYSPDGQFVMSRSTIMDNTERKMAEIALRHSRDELSIANAALEKASRTKDEFLANMSHELRTPLTGILGMAEILLDGVRGPLSDYQRKLISTIDSSGRHLLSLINDLLDLSKIEAGRLEIHPEKVSIVDVCQASLSFVKEPAMKKGLLLKFIPDPTATSMLVDARRLKQMLVNLLGNAVKFTPSPGKVTLQVTARPQQNAIEFSVCDTGVGILPEDLQRLFTPFTQVDSSLTRQHEGTGLGLALVKNLAELHGGSITVTSETGQGSCFTIALPWQDSQATPGNPTAMNTPLTENAASTSQVSATILLVEDAENNILVMGEYLGKLGYQMMFARSGREALEKIAINTPDLILMDIQMPVMDGLEATRILRATPEFASTPIIALTALTMPGDRERCLAAGANEYISKPVSLRRLAELIQKLLDERTSP